jgi:hypothetical protein
VRESFRPSISPGKSDVPTDLPDFLTLRSFRSFPGGRDKSASVEDINEQVQSMPPPAHYHHHHATTKTLLPPRHYHHHHHLVTIISPLSPSRQHRYHVIITHTAPNTLPM